jgi:hypothetical protein
MENQDELPEEFTSELPYEVEQMRKAHLLLVSGRTFDLTIENALIESVAVHARNLVEIFLSKPNALNPSIFMIESYTSLYAIELQDLYDSICAGVTHLREDLPHPTRPRIGRVTHNNRGKFSATNPDVIALLERAIAHFIGQLRENCRLALCFTTTPIEFVPALPNTGETSSFEPTTGMTGAHGGR